MVVRRRSTTACPARARRSRPRLRTSSTSRSARSRRSSASRPYVLRYWETEFSAIRPQKSRDAQRVYRRRDVETRPADQAAPVRAALHDRGRARAAQGAGAARPSTWRSRAAPPRAAVARPRARDARGAARLRPQRGAARARRCGSVDVRRARRGRARDMDVSSRPSGPEKAEKRDETGRLRRPLPARFLPGISPRPLAGRSAAW